MLHIYSICHIDFWSGWIPEDAYQIQGEEMILDAPLTLEELQAMAPNLSDLIWKP
jgi:hypothetical protein